MSRFYDGQPVVCVWDRDRWKMLAVRRQPFVPTRGEKYVVARSALGMDDVVRVVLTAHAASSWNENGFEPITENQVQAIIAIATDLPEDWDIDLVRERETENA